MAGCVTASRTFGSAPCSSSSAALGSSRLLMASIRSAAGVWPESGRAAPAGAREPSGAGWTFESGSCRCLEDSTNLEDEIELRRETVRHLSRRHDQRRPDLRVVAIPGSPLKYSCVVKIGEFSTLAFTWMCAGRMSFGRAVVKRLDGAQRVAAIVAACRSALAAGNRCCRRRLCDPPARCRATPLSGADRWCRGHVP